MKPLFTLYPACSAEEALEVLRDGATVVGGGTMVVPALRRRELCPRRVVDLRRAGLAGVAECNGELLIGAMTTYEELARSPLARRAAPLLAAVADGITGGPQIRRQGTVGGSACYANPASDVPGALVASHARLRIAGRHVREEAADRFFTGAFATRLQPDELVTGIVVPACPRGSTTAYRKLKLCESSTPIVTAAATVRRSADGSAEAADVVVGGAAARPFRVMIEPDASAADIHERVDAALHEPWQDALADGSYRRSVAGVMARRALAAALETRAAA